MPSNVYSGSPKNGDTDNALLLKIASWIWGWGAGGGVPVTVAGTVGGKPVVGIQEVDSPSVKTTGYTIAAGALSWAFMPLSSYAGTIAGIDGTLFANGLGRNAQPGNTLPAVVIVCSAGSYIVWEGRPS